MSATEVLQCDLDGAAIDVDVARLTGQIKLRITVHNNKLKAINLNQSRKNKSRNNKINHGMFVKMFIYFFIVRS